MFATSGGRILEPDDGIYMRQQKNSFLHQCQRRHRAFLMQSAAVASGLVASGLAVFLSGGCHDGPLYAMKKVNPYFSMNEWVEDEKLGITDAQRADELTKVVKSIGRWSDQEQRQWLVEMDRILQYDQSPHMRGLAVQAGANSTVSESTELLSKGIKDDDFKVRMVAAKALGRRPNDPEATRILAEAVNTEANKDVRLAAIKSLGAHSGPQATDALKAAVQDNDLAFQHSAVVALRSVTGKDLGDEPDAWVAYLEKPQTSDAEETQQESWTERLRNFF